MRNFQIARTKPRQIQHRTLDEIKKILQSHKPELSEIWMVRSLGIFGSYVRGEARKGSDLDLLVEIDAEVHSPGELTQRSPGGQLSIWWKSPQASQWPPRDRRGRTHMKASRRKQGNFQGIGSPPE